MPLCFPVRLPVWLAHFMTNRLYDYLSVCFLVWLCACQAFWLYDYEPIILFASPPQCIRLSHLLLFGWHHAILAYLSFPIMVYLHAVPTSACQPVCLPTGLPDNQPVLLCFKQDKIIDGLFRTVLYGTVLSDYRLTYSDKKWTTYKACNSCTCSCLASYCTWFKRAWRFLWLILSPTLQPLIFSESRLRGKSMLFIHLSSSVGRN
jgi:hypothetical protein